MSLASNLPEDILTLIFNNLPHHDILSSASLSQHWRTAAQKHPRFFLYLSLVHGEHATVPLRSSPRHLRFVAALGQLATLRSTVPIAVRLEVWTDDMESGEAACLVYTLLPALRAAMPHISVLDLRLPREVIARETFVAAPMLRELVLGVTSGEDQSEDPLLLHPSIVADAAPNLTSIRLQGLRAPPVSASVVIEIDCNSREDRALTVLELIDVERGAHAEDWWLDSADMNASDTKRRATKLYYKTETQVSYVPGLDLSPLFRRRVDVLRLTGTSPLTASFTSGVLCATLVSSHTSQLLSTLAACTSFANILKLEMHAAVTPLFFDAFGGRAMPHTRELKIFHRKEYGAADALLSLISIASTHSLGGGAVHFPALRTLELDWHEDAERGRAAMSTDQALRLAAALGLAPARGLGLPTARELELSPVRGRVRLELRWIDVRGGSNDAVRVFRDAFHYR